MATRKLLKLLLCGVGLSLLITVAALSSQPETAGDQDRGEKVKDETKEDVTATESPPVWWQMIVDAIAIVLAVLVCLLAVHGEWFRSKFAGPKLRVEPHNLVGHEVSDERGQLMIYYHLRVKNNRYWAPAKGVRVLLKRYEHRGSGDFHEESVTIPYQFCWTPSETSATVQTITGETIFDLGCLRPDQNGNYIFVPVWYSMPFRQDNLFVHAGEAVRYHLKIVGENFYCDDTFGFEVEWDGQWSEDLDDLQNHLRITPEELWTSNSPSTD